MILVVILALVAHVSYALNDMSGALATRKFDGKLMSLMSWLLGMAVYVLLAPFLWNHSLYLWPTIVGLMTGAILGTAFPIFLKALKEGNPTLVGVIAGTFPLWVVIFSVLVYKEVLSGAELAAIAVITLGIVLSALHLSRKTRLHNLFSKSTLMALLVSVMWGIGFGSLSYPSNEIGWFEASMLSSTGGTVISMAWLYPQYRGRLKVSLKKFYIYPVANAITGVAGVLAYTLALTKGNSSIVAPIAGSYSGLFAVLSYFAFKEKLTRIQVGGVIIIIIGIISLSAIVARS